jgi:hypothetical protein
MRQYTVWVGSWEVNDYYLRTLESAQRIAADFIDAGYDDVEIEQVSVSNWNWTPRARMIGTLLQAIAVIGIGWFLFAGTWFAIGGM